jgi:eukaryotic-like serine/threonine-protein kinase
MGEREITARSDVYALGCVTYEMLIGDPPFTGSTAQAIVAKVMTADPPPLAAQRRSVSPQVESAVLTALEKLPADRFATAAEFALALNQRADAAPTRIVPAAARPRAMPRLAFIGGALGLVALGLLAGRWAAGRDIPPALTFLQRSFRDEAIYNARFASDGQTIVYSSAAEAGSPELFLIRPDYPAPTALGLTGTQLLSVSSKGELAVLVRAEFVRHRLFLGTLARVPIGGGAPREVLDSVREADWSPDGADLAIIHDVGGRDHLEFPIGKVVYEASGYLSDPRVSPDGRSIAFAEHPFRWDDRGTVKIVDRAGKVAAVTGYYPAIEGVAWRPNGREVLFGAYDNTGYVVRALGLNGRVRVAATGAGNLTPQDVSPSGRVLLTRDDAPFRLMLRGPGAASEVDVSWLDASLGPKLSRDGSLLAFADAGADAGTNYEVMLRKTGGGEVARLGEGEPAAFSPDGKWLLATVPSTPPRIVLYPTRAGAERAIAIDRFESIGSADWFPDGQSILFCGNRTGEASRCYVEPVAGGAPRAVTPPGTSAGFVSPDGQEVTAFSAVLGHRRYPVAGGGDRAIPGLTFHDQIVRWSPDGKAVIVGGPTSPTMDRVDVATGRRAPLVTVGSRPPGGPWRFIFFAMADDPQVYAYVGARYLSEIFTVDGVR